MRVAYSLPEELLSLTQETEARRKLVELYVLRCGPVTAGDVAWWIGYPKTLTVRVLDQVFPEFMSVRITGGLKIFWFITQISSIWDNDELKARQSSSYHTKTLTAKASSWNSGSFPIISSTSPTL